MMHVPEEEVIVGRDLHLLLVGKTGTGTSSTGNTILGQNVFASAFSFSSLTNKCQKQSSLVANRTITVVDSPNFYHSSLSVKDLRAEFEKGVKMSSPGLQALLLLLTPDTFTEQEADVVSLFKATFGEEALRFTLIVFTHGDKVNTSTMEDLIRKNRSLKNLVGECGGRYHVLNNKDLSNRTQVTELLEKIDRMVAENRNSCYTVEMFRNAQSLKACCKRVILSVWREKPHYLCLICVLALAMGATNAHNKQSVDLLNFTSGCLSGLLAVGFGSVTGKLFLQLCMRFSWMQIGRLKMLGIPCGFAAGGFMGKYMDLRGILFSLIAGLAGATGAAVVNQITH